MGGSAKLGIENDWKIVCARLRTELKQEAKQEMVGERGREPSRSAKSIGAAGEMFLYFFFLSAPL